MGETNQETKEEARCLQVSKEGFYKQFLTLPKILFYSLTYYQNHVTACLFAG